MTSQFSLEFYNYFMPLDLQSIINYLFGLACAKSQRGKGEAERESADERRDRTSTKNRNEFRISCISATVA